MENKYFPKLLFSRKEGKKIGIFTVSLKHFDVLGELPWCFFAIAVVFSGAHRIFML